jgi:hypothetical protein
MLAFAHFILSEREREPLFMSAVVASEIIIISVLLLGLIIVLVIHHAGRGDFTANTSG